VEIADLLKFRRIETSPSLSPRYLLKNFSIYFPRVALVVSSKGIGREHSIGSRSAIYRGLDGWFLQHCELGFWG
jgi:hypothetical protein